MEVKMLVIPLVILVCMFYVIIQMVRTGRVHRKGAKKLRKKLLPIFYGKKSLFIQKETDPEED